MREYGIVSPMFWIGATGRSLRKDPNAQRVAIYLMTSPMSEMTGVYYCPLASILNDVGTFEAPQKPLGSPSEGGVDGYASPIEGVKQAILTLVELDFCFYDFDSEFVFVKEMARWQIGESLKAKDNRVIGLRKYVKSMPKPIAARFIERYNNDFCLGFDFDEYVEIPREKSSSSEAPSKPLARDSIEPLWSQEQEQEQDQYIHNKQQTQICNEEPARDFGDFVCFGTDEIFDAPIKVQAEHAQLEKLESTPEDQPLSIVQLIAACKALGIKLSHTPKTEAISSRNTITLNVLRECAKKWKETETGVGYFVGILENASKDPDSVMPHEKQELTAETITDKQAGFFASKLVRDTGFCCRFGKGQSDFGVFASKVAVNLRNPQHFDEYKPYLVKLGLMNNGETNEKFN